MASIYPYSTNKQLKESFPNRSANSIYKQAYKLGFRRSKEMAAKNLSDARKYKGEHKPYIDKKGYRRIFYPNHERSDSRGYMAEHIIVFENGTGVTVPPNCCIHHLNGDKLDNRLSNLSMMNRGAHTVMHHEGKKCSEQTKKAISEKAKERFSDKRNHPFFKDVDVDEMAEMRANGATVKQICKEYNISKRTFYNKMEERNA